MSLNYLVPFALYVAVSSPATFKLTRGIAGSWVASAEGLATFPGLLLHALVFVLIVGYLMRLLNPRTSGYRGLGRGSPALPNLMGFDGFPAKI